MTTNQTIDGVPRELLERVREKLSQTDYTWSVGDPEDELRALLDAPAEEQQWVSIEAFNRVSTELEELKAAQPQVEPVVSVQVAWEACGGNPGIKATIEELLTALRLMNEAEDEQPQGVPVANPVLVYADSYRAMARQGVETVSIWSVITDLERNIAPLYAERPAPVAAVMPERRTQNGRQSLTSQDLGWNACLDELKRLNPNRPAHANPPPGTEPCGTHHDNDGLDDWRKP